MKKAYIAALLLIFVAGTVALVVSYQRDALRRIVQEHCVPGFRNHANPAPCIRVVLGSTSGEDNGYAILHDRKGGAHFLLIPTRTLRGIESAALLDPAAPDYVAAAWKNRDVLDRWLGRTLPRDAVGLAINPRTSRSQNQLHVHIECIGSILQQALQTQADAIGAAWTPITVAGHHLEARRIMGDDFKLANPIRQLASELPVAPQAPALWHWSVPTHWAVNPCLMLTARRRTPNVGRNDSAHSRPTIHRAALRPPADPRQLRWQCTSCNWDRRYLP